MMQHAFRNDLYLNIYIIDGVWNWIWLKNNLGLSDITIALALTSHLTSGNSAAWAIRSRLASASAPALGFQAPVWHVRSGIASIFLFGPYLTTPSSILSIHNCFDFNYNSITHDFEYENNQLQIRPKNESSSTFFLSTSIISQRILPKSCHRLPPILLVATHHLWL